MIDDEWASVGSVNLDQLSLFVSQELLLLARSPALAEALQLRFLDDLREAEEVRASWWRRRSLRERLLEGIGRVLRPLM